MAEEELLLLTPYFSSERGNTITARRLKNGMQKSGIRLHVVGMEDPGWKMEVRHIMGTGKCCKWHALNAVFAAAALLEEKSLQLYPYVLTLTGTDINFVLQGKPKSELLEGLEKSFQIVVFHEDFAKKIICINPKWENKLKIIPQGVWIPNQSAYKTKSDFGLPVDKKIFLLPSCLRPEKNIIEAVRAYSEAALKRDDLFLAVAGSVIDDNYAAKVQEAVRGCKGIKFLGEIPHKLMPSLYRTAYAVLNTSVAEGQPQALMEGMSLGVPGILSDVPGNRGLFTEGKEAFYYQGSSDLAAKMLIVADDPCLAAKMGDQGRKAVAARFDPDKEIQEYLYLYARMPSTCV